jgi:hypothetical protein
MVRSPKSINMKGRESPSAERVCGTKSEKLPIFTI